LKALSFSKTYNLFRLDEVLAYVKECLLKVGIPEANITSQGKTAEITASNKNVSAKITLDEGTITDQSLRYLKGKPNVRLAVVASSRNEETLIKLVEEFKKCLLTRISRGGG
jgi:hypothetical protein